MITGTVSPYWPRRNMCSSHSQLHPNTNFLKTDWRRACVLLYAVPAICWQIHEVLVHIRVREAAAEHASRIAGCHWRESQGGASKQLWNLFRDGATESSAQLATESPLTDVTTEPGDERQTSHEWQRKSSSYVTSTSSRTTPGGRYVTGNNFNTERVRYDVIRVCIPPPVASAANYSSFLSPFPSIRL